MRVEVIDVAAQNAPLGRTFGTLRDFTQTARSTARFIHRKTAREENAVIFQTRLFLQRPGEFAVIPQQIRRPVTRPANAPRAR